MFFSAVDYILSNFGDFVSASFFAVLSSVLKYSDFSPKK